MFQEQESSKTYRFVAELSHMGKRFIIAIPKSKNNEVEHLDNKPLRVTLEEVPLEQ